MAEAPLIELTVGDDDGAQTACLTIPEAIEVAASLLTEASDALDALPDEDGDDA